VCPLCDAVVSDGPPPAPGACPGCGARFVGDGESAPAAVEQGLSELSVDGVGAQELVNALFTVSPERCRKLGVTIASDEREGFYRWWLFLAAGRDARDQLETLLAESCK